MSRLVRRIRWYLPAVTVFVATIVLWELLVGAIKAQRIPLPAPTAIASAFIANWSTGQWPLGPSAAATLFEAMGGLVIGTLAGLFVAGLTARPGS